MEWYEARAALKYAHYAVMDDWERTRFEVWATCQVNSTRRLDLESVMKFPWEDSEKSGGGPDKITAEDVARLRAESAAYVKSLGTN